MYLKTYFRNNLAFLAHRSLYCCPESFMSVCIFEARPSPLLWQRLERTQLVAVFSHISVPCWAPGSTLHLWCLHSCVAQGNFGVPGANAAQYNWAPRHDLHPLFHFFPRYQPQRCWMCSPGPRWALPGIRLRALSQVPGC